MKNNFMLTPYFLDKAEPGLWLAAQPDWPINQQTLPQGTAQARMAIFIILWLTSCTNPQWGQGRLVSPAIAVPLSVSWPVCSALGLPAHPHLVRCPRGFQHLGNDAQRLFGRDAVGHVGRVVASKRWLRPAGAVPLPEARSSSPMPVTWTLAKDCAGRFGRHPSAAGRATFGLSSCRADRYTSILMWMCWMRPSCRR